MTVPPATQISTAEVSLLLRRAAAASASQNAIIAVVDRGGHILGVRVEQGVINGIDAVANGGNGNGVIDTVVGAPDPEIEVKTLVYAIDGAVAKARTAAFFANGDKTATPYPTVGPLTSRTVRFISQTTITQREVESNPNDPNPASRLRGPGFVAPIGIGGHFPPGIMNAPQVDLFGIENTNRDSIVHPGLDSIKGTGDDIALTSRFNVPTSFIPVGQGIDAPESYGYTSGRMPNAQSRGIATLPGGIPLYRGLDMLGGIGVFFPGTVNSANPNNPVRIGDATFEQGFVPGIGQTAEQRVNAPKVLEAEWIAFAAAGGSSMAGATVGAINGVPAVPFNYPFGRIDLVGITLQLIGPTAGINGVRAIQNVGTTVGVGNPNSGANQPLVSGGATLLAGVGLPEGWLVSPHGSTNGTAAITDDITGADVIQIVNQSIASANTVRSAIRLQVAGTSTFPGARSRMVIAVSDKLGNVLGLYRMRDATFFSIDVAVAKARNTAYYANPGLLQAVDRVDDDRNGIPDPNIPLGTAFSNRTFRFLAAPYFPEGIDGTTPGAFSILRDPGHKTSFLSSTNPAINNQAVENVGAPVAANLMKSVLGFDAFNPGRNFRNPLNIANQNGVVFFPGSTPLYKSTALAGGFGISGDGVDQDDVVTFFGNDGYRALAAIMSDKFYVRGSLLPYQKFNRNPFA